MNEVMNMANEASHQTKRAGVQTEPKIAVVTGASRGIGRAIALALAENGYSLAICCRTQMTRLQETKKEALKKGAPTVLTRQVDVSVYEECAGFCQEILQQYGHVDVLVNNAGISLVELFQDLTPTEWNKIVSTNIGSVYSMIHELLPSMIHRKTGRILNISSVWGNVGGSCETAYSATKGAVNALTKALGKELAPSGIAVNALACGAINTEMNSCFGPDALKELAEEIPAGRLAAPEEVAQAALLLLKADPYLTGQVVTFDGGWLS